MKQNRFLFSNFSKAFNSRLFREIIIFYLIFQVTIAWDMGVMIKDSFDCLK